MRECQLVPFWLKLVSSFPEVALQQSWPKEKHKLALWTVFDWNGSNKNTKKIEKMTKETGKNVDN